MSSSEKREKTVGSSAGCWHGNRGHLREFQELTVRKFLLTTENSKRKFSREYKGFKKRATR